MSGSKKSGYHLAPPSSASFPRQQGSGKPRPFAASSATAVAKIGGAQPAKAGSAQAIKVGASEAQPQSPRYVNVATGTGLGPPSAAAWKQGGATAKVRSRFSQASVAEKGLADAREEENALSTPFAVIDGNLEPTRSKPEEDLKSVIELPQAQPVFVPVRNHEKGGTSEFTQVQVRVGDAVKISATQCLSPVSPYGDGTVSPGVDSTPTNVEVDAIYIENRRLREELERQRIQIQELSAPGKSVDINGMRAATAEEEEGKRGDPRPVIMYNMDSEKVSSILKKSCKVASPPVKFSPAQVSPRKVFGEGSRVEAFFHGEWYVGFLMTDLKTDAEGTNWWIVQCDVHKKGELIYVQSVRNVLDSKPKRADSCKIDITSGADISSGAQTAPVPSSPVGVRLRAPRATIAPSTSLPPWAADRLKQNGGKPPSSPRDTQPSAIFSDARSVPASNPSSSFGGTHIAGSNTFTPRDTAQLVTTSISAQSVSSVGNPFRFYSSGAGTPSQSPRFSSRLDSQKAYSSTTHRSSVSVGPSPAVAPSIPTSVISLGAAMSVIGAQGRNRSPSPRHTPRAFPTSGTHSVPTPAMPLGLCSMRSAAPTAPTQLPAAAAGSQITNPSNANMSPQGTGRISINATTLSASAAGGHVGATQFAARPPRAQNRNHQLHQQSPPQGFMMPRAGATPQTMIHSTGLAVVGAGGTPIIFGPSSGVTASPLMSSYVPTLSVGGPPQGALPGLPVQANGISSSAWTTRSAANVSSALTPNIPTPAETGLGSGNFNQRSVFHFSPGKREERRVSLPGWENADSALMYTL